MQPSRIRNVKSSGSNIPLDPKILRVHYNITMNAIGTKDNRQAAIEFADNFFSPADIDLFFHYFWNNKNFTSQVDRIIGLNDEHLPTIRAR